MKQQIIFGEQSINLLKTLFHDKKWNKVLLVTGKKSYETSGAKQFISKCLSGINVQIVRFSDFANNPNINDLKKGISMIQDSPPSVIVAIGGGSVLDMGKLLRFFLTHKGDILGGDNCANGKTIPLIAIPTTAGTGAEATHFAVIYDEEGKKHSIANIDILPEFAVVYPKLTYNQSLYVTACAGFDALAQAIEAYWNKKATIESDEYALKAMELIYPSLPIAVNNPTELIRDKMSEGAYWAGCAINITKTTAPHAFSYPFTSHYGYPHGHALAIMFPELAAHNIINGNIPEEKKIKLLQLFNIGQGNVYDTIKKYINQLPLPLYPKSYDINTILKGISIERLSNNPSYISEEEAKRLIQKVLADYTIIS